MLGPWLTSSLASVCLSRVWLGKRWANILAKLAEIACVLALLCANSCEKCQRPRTCKGRLRTHLACSIVRHSGQRVA
jgi:hypothetical protein